MSPVKRAKPASSAATSSTVPFTVEGGATWARNVRLANDHAEIIITLDVGPRVISYRRLPDGANVFKTYAEQVGGAGESEWKIRGGHRLWVAPESLLSYALDNEVHLCVARVALTCRVGLLQPVLKWEANGSQVEIHSRVQSGVQKLMGVAMRPDGSVRVWHKLVNAGTAPLRVAPWALTVCRPGGVEVIPQPPLGKHPRDLLPNRTVVLWPYTDLKDRRLDLGTQFLRLEQRGDCGPVKFGLAHRGGAVAYVVDADVFVKRFGMAGDDAEYPDGGVNFETFSNEDMLEVETLGPLEELGPGDASAELVEEWTLQATPTGFDVRVDDQVRELFM